jgi:hypothetical protein
MNWGKTIGLAVGSATFLFVPFGVDRWQDKTREPQPHEFKGHAVLCRDESLVGEKKGFPFKEGDRAEIVEYGLDDPRGLAIWGDHSVLIADRNRPVLVYRQGLPGNDETKRCRPTCRGNECATDIRGIASFEGRAIAAEYSQQRIAEVQSMETCPVLAGTFRSTLDQIGRPIGLAFAEKTLFFTREDAPAEKYGSLQAIETDTGKVTRLDEKLSHPSGVAADAANGLVFVAEHDQREVRWPVYQKDSGGWPKHGALGSALIENAPLATFLGIAVDPDGRVYAAGPGGLYVLRQNVGVIGKITMNEPVSGVAIQDRYVYFTAGHELCRIKMRSL